MATRQAAEIKRLEPRTGGPGPRLKAVHVLAGDLVRLAREPMLESAKLEMLIAADERRAAQTARCAYVSARTAMAQDLPVITEAGKIIAGDKIVSTYALWEDVNEVLRPLLARHGFALSFRTAQEGEAITVTAVLDHREGHQEATSLRLPADVAVGRNSVQAVGSSVSYGKRYTACALLNITTRGEDNDARSSGALVTSEQVLALEARLKALNTSPKRLLRYLKAESLALIPAQRFDEAVSVLNAKADERENVR